jgi:hypothetical protein
VSAELIKCPNCGSEIPLTDVIESQIEQQLELRLTAQAEQAEVDKAEALKAQESELRAALTAENEAREAELREKAAAEVSTELADLQARIEEQAGELKKAQDQELAFRREKRKLEEERASFELEIARRVDAEREKVATEATERQAEEHRLKLTEKDVQLEQMKRQIKELQESSEQMRSGLRGEVLERDVEDVLREHFPEDQIEPIRSGVKGADVLEVVRSRRSQPCGAILWESKRTKAWSNGWIAKVKEDAAEKKADIAVIVSTVLPADCERMEWRDGVWIIEPSCVTAMATALRQTLIKLEHSRAIDINRSQVRDALYEYLAGDEFRQWLITLVEIANEQRDDLESEKRAYIAKWKKREKQIERLEVSSASIYGDLQGVMGPALATVDLLELAPPPAAAELSPAA